MIKTQMHLLLIAALAVMDLSTASDAHWGYPDLDNGEEYQDWGGICDTGRRQSPINLSQNGALKGLYTKLDFENYDEAQSDVTMVNNGHTIQLSNFPFLMELDGGPLSAQYVVEQIHLHWWSEHTIDNIRYPLEVHIVHRNKRYENMTVAGNYSDGITVVGVLYHVSNGANDAIEEILENLDDVKDSSSINKPIKMKNPFNVRDLFPDIRGYITYSGSLTTPNCAEAVTWIVLTETFPVTLEQVNRFQEVEYDEDKQLKNNYRNIQPTNNRAMIVVLSDGDAKDDDGASTAQVSLAVMLFAILYGLFLH